MTQAFVLYDYHEHGPDWLVVCATKDGTLDELRAYFDNRIQKLDAAWEHSPDVREDKLKTLCSHMCVALARAESLLEEGKGGPLLEGHGGPELRLVNVRK